MANPPIPIDYNPALQPLTDVLSTIERPGDFYAMGRVEAPMPKIAMKGGGQLSFPVPEAQAREWIAHAEQAPYGRGEETIVDSDVRKVWQIQPANVRITGKSWISILEGIVTNCARDLGCLDTQVSAEFYKLLIYEPGGFFLTHRDTEKSPGMFATLVLSLPSIHAGGDLLVRHDGREATIQLVTDESSEITYAAFYADCEHEVRPIESGHRVCLVYNVIQTNKGGGAIVNSTLESPDYRKETREATRLLQRWFDSPKSTPKIVYLLEHQYSPEGLSFAGLKNGDAALAQLFRNAADEADLALHLAIVHIEETGAAEPQWDSRPRYGRRYWDEDDDDVEFDIAYQDDVSQSLSDFRNLRDEAVDFGSLPLEDGELLPIDALVDEPLDQQRVTEATGNEGASYERSYHRACLVLWPTARFGDVLLAAGAPAVLPHLRDRVGCWLKDGSGSKRGSVWTELNRLAERILDAWKVEPSYAADSKPEHRRELMDSLVQIGNVALLERGLERITLRFFDGAENDALTKAVTILGPRKTSDVLTPLLSKRFPVQPKACVELLARLTSEAPSVSAPWKKTMCNLAETTISCLGRVKLPSTTRSYFSRHYGGTFSPEPEPHPVDPDFVQRLIVALEDSGGAKFVERGIEALLAKPKVYPPGSILTATVQMLSLDKMLAQAASRRFLWNATAAAIIRRTAKTPRLPRDWAQKPVVKCNCQFCSQINRFARQAAQQELRIKAKKSDRQHMHNAIDSANLEMSHETERKGSPYTLVLTKTRRDFETKLAQFNRDLRAAERLIAHAPNGSSKLVTELTRNLSQAGS